MYKRLNRRKWKKMLRNLHSNRKSIINASCEDIIWLKRGCKMLLTSNENLFGYMTYIREMKRYV